MMLMLLAMMAFVHHSRLMAAFLVDDCQVTAHAPSAVATRTCDLDVATAISNAAACAVTMDDDEEASAVETAQVVSLVVCAAILLSCIFALCKTLN